MCGWLVLLHLRMIASSAPQEMREGGVVWITRLLLEGRNIYAVDELPASTNVYGIVYHLVVFPFARAFGNSYTVHRAISGAAIAFACVLFYRLLRREHVDRLLAAVGVMMFYVSSMYFVAPLARPDSLGMLLTVAGMATLFQDQLTPSRFLLGLAISVVALLTKVYFAYPLFVMSAYVFMFVSPRRGLLYGATAIVVSLAVLLAMTIAYPGYITTSVVANINAESFYDAEHMRRQSLDWIVYSLPLLVALVIVTARGFARRRAADAFGKRPDIFTFAAVANSALFFLWLGGHPGAHMTYLFHLVTPALTVALLTRIAPTGWPPAAVACALPLALALNAHYFPLTFSRFSAAESTFARVTQAIEAHRNVTGSPEIAGPLTLADRTVVDSGQSQYFGTAAIELPLPGLLSASTVNERWAAFTGEISENIQHQNYDLILRSRRPGLLPADLIAASYVRTQTIDLDFPWGAQNWPVDFWEPRK